jgi:hypothetical protein
MVIDAGSALERTRRLERHWTDDASYRLAAVVARDPSVELVPDRRIDSGVGALAARLEPIVSWARALPDEADDTAIRRGVHVAATRALLGVPRRTILVAFHELPATMASETPAPSRLEALAIEVGLRLRRLPAQWDVAPAS